MRDLPLIDEHSVETEAPPERVWDAMWRTLRKSFGGSTLSKVFARAVGVRERDPLLGFRVAEERPGELLVLEGSHRFARYRWRFRLEDGRLSAATWADFGSGPGQVYRLLVIRSGMHVRVVKRILRAIARRAARS